MALACSAPQFDPAVDAARPPQTAQQLLDRGHYRRALALLTKPAEPAADPSGAVISAAPAPQDVAQHQYLLSRAELGLGAFDEALALAEKAVQAAPNNADYHVQIAAVVGRMAEHASMFKQLSYAKRAKKELDAALALDPKNGDAIYGLMIFEDLAPAFIGGDKAKAQNLAGQLTGMDASRGYMAQAELAHNHKDYDAQNALLARAVAAAGEFGFEARVAYARYLLDAATGAVTLARLDLADEMACQAIGVDPARSDGWQILARMAADADCVPEVNGLVDTAAKFAPDDLSPAFAAAAEWVNAGKHLPEAQALLQSYMARPQEGDAPTAGRARYTLAEILEKQGHRPEALDLMRIALAEDPTMDDARKTIKRLEQPARGE